LIKIQKLETDEIDFKIACLLKENSKLSYKAIGEKVSLSASSVYERVKSMETSGIIKQYVTEIDWDRFGYAIHAFILIKDDKFIGSTPDFLEEKEEIFNCWMVSGEYDYLVEVYTINNKSLEILMNYLYEKIGRTKTMLIIRNLFNNSKNL
jgi:Lrp/AsnC family leucine-responsive transcriptional regulator